MSIIRIYVIHPFRSHYWVEESFKYFLIDQYDDRARKSVVTEPTVFFKDSKYRSVAFGFMDEYTVVRV